MQQPDYVAWIEQARAGDLDAFARVVEAFQDLAIGAAFGWLGQLDSARDVTQEAFLDAHAHLHELRDPAAFPAWLRRIVVKHCDRVTRRGNRFTELTAPDLARAAEQAPDEQVLQAARASDLRLAVGALPPQERIVVALGYFAELSGAQTAEFLEVPLSTVKKRLRAARARLREHGDRLMQQSLDHLRPSRSEAFTDLVTFFLALRAGDHARVRSMLARAPQLVDAVQEWDPELVRDGVLPFANRATAVITAIERDDPVMLRLLLDAGAAVDGPCACATGESPVWAATLLDRRPQLRVLLDRGADPNRASAAGNTPLHVAAMRGNVAAVELLLAAGADPTRHDRQGLTAADWAARQGHAALARRLAPGGRSTRAADPPARTPARGPGQPVLFTGIKALDLFCPIPRAAVVRVPFMAGVGMLVLVGELCERVTRTGGVAVWTGFAQRPFDVADWRAEMSELGILDRVELSMADLDATAEQRREAFQQGVARACGLRAGGCDVLLVLLSDDGFEGDVEAALPELVRTDAPGSVTTLLITPFPERAGATWSAPAPPYGAQLRLDRARARRGLYPSVEPALCWSRALSDAGVGARHVRLAAAARDLLAPHAARDPQFQAVARAEVVDPHFASQARAPVTGDGEEDRSRALLHYLTQPFHVAEPFTGRPGEWVGQEQLLQDLEKVLGLS